MIKGKIFCKCVSNWACNEVKSLLDWCWFMNNIERAMCVIGLCKSVKKFLKKYSIQSVKKARKIPTFWAQIQAKIWPKNLIFRSLKRGHNSPNLPKISLFLIIPIQCLGLLKLAKSLRYKDSFFYSVLLKLCTCSL